jgi:5-amino-6-(5-phospho-D-ribitylamino)uracil phosphatase
MTRHLIGIDVDGTLLDEGGQLSAFTKKVLHERQSLGDVIVLASGRPWRSLRSFYEELGLTGPVVCYNGALVFNPMDSSFAPLEKRLKATALRSVAKKMSSLLESTMCETQETIYLDKADSFLAHYFPYDHQKMIEGPIDHTLAENPFTALYKVKDGNSEALRQAVEAHAPMRFRHWRGVPYAEAYYEGGDKGSAIRYLMKELGFQKDDVIAFGDSDNDYEMLSLAGQAFAMEGGRSPLLLRDFPHTKKGNDYDGVALALVELLG